VSISKGEWEEGDVEEREREREGLNDERKNGHRSIERERETLKICIYTIV
jgi:hypothetical protein